MLEQLKIYLSINEIPDYNALTQIGEKIQSNVEKNLYVYTKKGAILNYFKDLLNGKIDAEQFVTIGDISSELKLAYLGQDYEALFKIYNDIFILNKNIDNSIFVVDQKAKINFQNKIGEIKYKEFLSEIQNNNSEIYFI